MRKDYTMKIVPKYPGYVSRAITFSIDDGNLDTDKKFMDIVKPHGIRGTFNLCYPKLDLLSAEGYRELYEGFEISNHVKHHPFALADGTHYTYMDAPPSPPIKGDYTRLYPLPKGDERCGYALYINDGEDRARYVTDGETYFALAEECREALEEIFGEGSVRGFVWPYHEQYNAALTKRLVEAGYYGLRSTGETRDKDSFALPRDRVCWSYNADHKSLLEVAALYEKATEDDGLKFFCFGVHSIDFERAGTWHKLKEFAEKYGGRPDTYYYATVGEIFAYEDAVNALIVLEKELQNPSSIDVYVTANGVPLSVPALSTVSLN